MASALITTSQQASLGAASLTTIAAGATSSAPAGLGVARATVHRYALAHGWAGGINAAAGLAIGFLIPHRAR